MFLHHTFPTWRLSTSLDLYAPYFQCRLSYLKFTLLAQAEITQMTSPDQHLLTEVVAQHISSRLSFSRDVTCISYYPSCEEHCKWRVRWKWTSSHGKMSCVADKLREPDRTVPSNVFIAKVCSSGGSVWSLCFYHQHCLVCGAHSPHTNCCYCSYSGTILSSMFLWESQKVFCLWNYIIKGQEGTHSQQCTTRKTHLQT